MLERSEKSSSETLTEFTEEPNTSQDLMGEADWKHVPLALALLQNSLEPEQEAMLKGLAEKSPETEQWPKEAQEESCSPRTSPLRTQPSAFQCEGDESMQILRKI